MHEIADIAVIGLGAAGSAVLYQLARRGVRVVGIDRFHPPHTLGSSHGESRITRLSVGEGPAYAPLVRRSHAIWRALEAESGETLMRQTGGIIMAPAASVARHHGQDNFVRRCAEVATRFGIAHEMLDAAEAMHRFPQLRLTGEELCFWEPEAGLLHPEACIAAQLRLARAAGAVLRTGEQVLAVEQDGATVRVRTAGGTIEAARAVVAAGPWVAGLLGGEVAALTRVYRQTLHWFAAADPAAYAPGRFPIFLWMHGHGEEDYFYGFPSLGEGVKVASERYAAATDPDLVDRTVAPAESQAMHARHVAGRLEGVTARALRASACLYTVAPGARFLVDELPDRPGVTVVSACSGHGFKHSAALGEAVAERVLDGRSGIDLSGFAFAACPAGG
jgi:sarcosine oxidase